MSEHELEAKFMRCAERVLATATAHKLLEWLKHAAHAPAAELCTLINVHRVMPAWRTTG